MTKFPNALLLLCGGLAYAATGPVNVSPAAVSVRVGTTKQFTANQAVTWSAAPGTISSMGLYTAPAVLPASNTATVTATASDGVTKGIATVTLLNPQPAISSVSPTSVTDNL